MRASLKNHKGFLIVEALISITILLMVSATVVTLLVYANRAINFNAHSLEASWLTQEGVNAFRGLRDTNWIRFSFDKENCWNMTTGACDPSNAITAGTNYTIETSPINPPQLVSRGNALDLTDDGINETDEPYRLFIQADGTISHDPAGEKTIYFRTVEVGNVTANRIDAVSRIEWLEGSDPKSISLPVTITNFALEE